MNIDYKIKKSGNISYTKVRSTSHIISVLRNLGTTQNSSKELEQMGLDFSFPKPKGLIKYLLQFHSTIQFLCTFLKVHFEKILYLLNHNHNYA